MKRKDTASDLAIRDTYNEVAGGCDIPMGDDGKRKAASILNGVSVKQK